VAVPGSIIRKTIASCSQTLVLRRPDRSLCLGTFAIRQSWIGQADDEGRSVLA